MARFHWDWCGSRSELPRETTEETNCVRNQALVVIGERETRIHILLYSLQLVAFSLLLPLADLGGGLYMLLAGSLGLVLVLFAVQLWKQGGNRQAWGMYRYSSTYLALIFFALVADTLIFP